eukprot:363116-Chlamydomonas_euryale.AAC.16
MGSCVWNEAGKGAGLGDGASATSRAPSSCSPLTFCPPTRPAAPACLPTYAPGRARLSAHKQARSLTGMTTRGAKLCIAPALRAPTPAAPRAHHCDALRRVLARHDHVADVQCEAKVGAVDSGDERKRRASRWQRRPSAGGVGRLRVWHSVGVVSGAWHHHRDTE